MKGAKWAVWVLLFLTLPVPYFMVDVGWVPTARLVLLGGFTAAAAVLEPSSTAALLAGVFLAQIIFYSAALFGISVFVGRRIEAVRTDRGRRALLGAICVVMVAASLFKIYRTPMAKAGPRSNLVGIFR